MSSDHHETQKSSPSRIPVAGQAGTLVQITLNAVLAALEDGEPKVLCTKVGAVPNFMMALPYGPFDPLRHRTFEIGLRDWVARQTNVTIGYIEQLYTFGDRGRESISSDDDQHEPSAVLPDASTSSLAADHSVSVGYLALVPLPAEVDVRDASWRNWYRFFPWEDWRKGEPDILDKDILPKLFHWAEGSATDREKNQREQRIRLAFGFSDTGWEEERILERYELMYEAQLVDEAIFSQTNNGSSSEEARGFGLSMASDHRRILATAIARLRGKLKYRPIIFEMLPSEFTLLALQKRVEAIIGFQMHKQNFRRSVESSGLVERTGNMSNQAGGRPAALFKVNRDQLKDRAAKGLVIPRLKAQPKN